MFRLVSSFNSILIVFLVVRHCTIFLPCSYLLTLDQHQHQYSLPLSFCLSPPPSTFHASNLPRPALPCCSWVDRPTPFCQSNHRTVPCRPSFKSGQASSTGFGWFSWMTDWLSKKKSNWGDRSIAHLPHFTLSVMALQKSFKREDLLSFLSSSTSSSFSSSACHKPPLVSVCLSVLFISSRPSMRWMCFILLCIYCVVMTCGLMWLWTAFRREQI